MKKQSKKLLALLLAICSLVTFAMPTVFATGDGLTDGAEESVPAPESTLYTFYTEALGKVYRKVADEAPILKAAFDDGTGNWRYEAADGDYQFRPAGSNKFREDVQSLMYNTGASNATTTRFFALRLKSPGEGKFDLAFTHGGSASGAKKGSVYFVDAAIIDEALGENATAYAEAMAASVYQPGAGIYSAYAAAITEAIKGQTAAIVADYTAAGTAEGVFTFEKDKEYVAVFTSDVASTLGNLYLVSLLATKSAEQEEAPAEPVDYILYTPELGNAYTKLSVQAAVIKEAYDEGAGNWRFEAADGGYQFRPAGANKFNKEVSSLVYTTGASNSTTTRFFAIRIKSPGEGKFDLTFTHGVSANGAKKGSVYFVDAAVIDEALGENATAYAEAMAADPYQPGDGIYTAYYNAIIQAIKDQSAVMTVDYTSEDAGQGAFTFEKDKEYVAVFTSDVASAGGNLYFVSLRAEYAENQGDEPEEPAGPAYTDGLYDFNDILLAGSNLSNSIDALAKLYEENQLNWKYETKGGTMDLTKVAYHSPTDSLRAISAKNWWLAFRIKAPAEDGQYDIRLTHGATSEGAPAGSVFVIPGDTPTNQIFKVASKKGATFTTDWNYGENSGDTISGRVSETGTVNMKAGQEYIVVFLPTEASPLNGNACFYMGQLQLERTGDYVEEEGSSDAIDGVEYEFYDWDNPGHFLNHYKTEAELGKKILTQKIADEYAAGERNWTYQGANGFANFSTGTPYMNINVGETHYYVLKIKAPGTGTYEITYNHLAMNDTSSGLSGGVFILPYTEGIDYATIRDDANFKDPIITTSYYAEKTTQVQKTGTYTAFQEGKEYLVCFSVEDTDVTNVRTLKAYPVSMIMKRTGEYAPEAGEGYDDGIVYKLALKEFAGKAAHTGEAYTTVNTRYANGTSNWKIESGIGSTRFYSKYLQLGTGYSGKCWAIRIKAPGTGEYKVTLHYMRNFIPSAANLGEIYIREAPKTTIAGANLNSYMSTAPVMELTYSCGGTRFQKVSANGTYSFQEDKEYIVIFYGQDDMDKTTTVDSTYMYVDRLVMKRIGDYKEPENAGVSHGGLVMENMVKTFETNTQYCHSVINGHDYIGISTFGQTLMIYDVDEWRMVDEVQTKVHTPRGSAVDNNGNYWVCGNSQYLYCYNPYTGEGFNTAKFEGISSFFSMSVGEDGYLYFGGDITGNVFRYNPETQKYSQFSGLLPWATYVTEVHQKGDYIYASFHGENQHAIVMLDKLTGKVIKVQDITEEMGTQRYLTGAGFISDDLFLASVHEGIAVFKTETLERVSAEEFGIKGPVNRFISSIEDGKAYFHSETEGLCCYDSALGKAYALGGDLATGINGLRCSENSLFTIDDSRLPNPCIVSYGGMSASGVSLFAYNLEDKIRVELIGLIDPGYGDGQELRNIGVGLPGSNEIFIGTMYGAPIGVYNVEQQSYVRGWSSIYQSDSILAYNGVMYAGEYTQCCITKLGDGSPTMLFTLNDRGFNQARIHKMAGGDNKIFFGTIPDVFRNGGVIGWYDLETELVYVATGPNPEDCYYTSPSQIMTNKEWYRVTNDELVDFEQEWDADQTGDGVNESFAGFISYQSIQNVQYKDGLLIGTSTVQGGTSSVRPEGESAKIFIYDVENHKTLKVIDIRDYFTGFPERLIYLPSIAADPDISNKYWVVAAETLFSFTFDPDTGKVNFKKELSFSMTSFRDGGPIQWAKDIYFLDDGYMIVLFDRIGGLCKINRNDPSDYVHIMSNFRTTGDIPRNMTMAEDGNIYFITGGTNVYVVDPTVTEEDLAAAQAVQDAIDLISDAVTPADREAILAARDAWNAIHPAYQPYINNYDKLKEAEIALLQLRVEALKDGVTIEDEQELFSIRDTYITLTTAQRMTIDYRIISEAMSQMSILRAERTTNIIAALGEITLDKEAAIRAARASYIDLTIYERRLVTNLDTLNAAESVLTGLLLQQSEAAAVDRMIDKIGFVFFGDGAQISAARKAYNKLDENGKAWVEDYGTLVAAEIILVAEYVLAVAIVAMGALYLIPATREKIFKKKTKA